MKHNPRLNEKMARLPGFADIHPLQPQATVQGALELIDTLATWLKTLTGMPEVAMSPKAGAHGELCGMLAIRAALDARGDDRKVVLVPESAHGTNPATAAFCGFTVENIPADARGRVDTAALKAQLGPDVAAVMITNPNTCGLFEPDMVEICDAVHAAGGFVYCDGANFNAIVGRVRPGDLGIDAMHINLHKTFSTPHGGGGPGSGPVVFSAALAPFAPLPFVRKGRDGFELVEEMQARQSKDHDLSFGRMVAFHGQMGMFVRALSYMMSHGADGLRQVAEDAVLNANYILRQPEGHLHRALRRHRPVHARSAVLGRLPRWHRPHHPRSGQGADRRRLPPDDDVFPARRPRRHARRADRNGIEGQPRSVHRRDAPRRNQHARRPRRLAHQPASVAAPPPRRDGRRAQAGAELQGAAGGLKERASGGQGRRPCTHFIPAPEFGTKTIGCRA